MRTDLPYSTDASRTADAALPDGRAPDDAFRAGGRQLFAASAARVSPLRSATRYRGVPSSHMILEAALEVPWYRPTS